MQIGKRNCSGFTYLGMLMIVVISGISMATVGIVWRQDLQREREMELLFIGKQFQRAIASYYETTPSGVKEFPRKLDDLLYDTRYPSTKRHLRRIYADPMTRRQDWVLILQQERVVGVHSFSNLEPVKKQGFKDGYERFSEAKTYQDWQFTYAPGAGSLLSPVDDSLRQRL